MAFFEDLAPCSYFGRWEDLLVAVGWLEGGNQYARGAVSEEVFAALVRLCLKPWQPAATAGRRPCPFCRFSGGPGHLTYQGTTIVIGATNLFIPDADRVFVAPTMITHYIDAHGYAPPPEFQDAVMRSPEMGSFAYLKEIRTRGVV